MVWRCSVCIDQRIQFGDQYIVERTPKEEIYAQLEADLAQGAQVLPNVAAEAGRVTKEP